MLKILHICPIFPPPYPKNLGSGVVSVVYDLSKELVRREHEVTVYTSAALDLHTKINQVTNPLIIDGIKVYYFPYILSYYTFFITPGIIFALRKNLRNFDIIHIHDIRCFQAIACYHYAKRYNLPYVVQPHNSPPKAPRSTRLRWILDITFAPRILRHADKVIAVSQEEVAYDKQSGAEDNKISVIYNGFDIAQFENLPKYGEFREKYNLNGAMLLYLGRIHETKGLDFLVKAFSELRCEINDVALVIGGEDRGYRTKLEGIIKDLGLSNKVKFTGRLDENDKLAAYVDADLFLHTVKYMGGVGIAPLEAILCGTPVIVTPQCGETIREANCGYFVEYGDVDDLKAKMKRALENPEEGKEMVNRGKKYIYENLTWNMVVEKVEGIYHEVLQAKRSPS